MFMNICLEDLKTSEADGAFSNDDFLSQLIDTSSKFNLANNVGPLSADFG